MADIQEKLLKIVNEVLIEEGKKAVEIYNCELKLREDLEFDSLMLAVLTVKIENDFNIDIFEDGLVYTLGDVLAKVVNNEVISN